MNLGFNLLCNEDFTQKENIQEFFDSEYAEDFCTLSAAQRDYEALKNTFDQVCVAHEFLQHHRIDNSLYSVLCERFGLEEVIGLPRNCINTSNSFAYTQVCLEGLGSIIKTVCKKIWEFFMKLYKTIMNFFGIRSFRHRNLENELLRIMRAVDKLSDSEFNSINHTSFKANVPVMSARTIDLICSDVESLYNTIMATKDVEQIKGMVSAFGGILTKLGCEIVNEYQIKDAPVMPYSESKEGETIETETEIGLKSRRDIVFRIERVLKILKTILDLQRWYPANLRKYASQAEVSSKVSDAEAQKTIQVLNERQKCQAFECKLIVIYMTYVDYLCARTIASFGIFAKE